MQLHTPIWQRAVSLAWLIEFAKDVPEGYSTEDLTNHIIKPATEARRCRYVELHPEEVLGGVVPSQNGAAPFYFVSHRGSRGFKLELVPCLARHFGLDEGHRRPEAGRQKVEPSSKQRSAAPPYVFIDTFAVNQVGCSKLRLQCAMNN